MCVVVVEIRFIFVVEFRKVNGPEFMSFAKMWGEWLVSSRGSFAVKVVI